MRADADRQVGTGHVARCLALARAWIGEGCACRLVTTGIDLIPPGLLPQDGILVRDLGTPRADHGLGHLLQEVESASRQGPVVGVVDGYHYDEDFHAAVRSRAPLVVIDDLAHLRRYEAEIVVNQNVHARGSAYRTPPGTTLLLGPRFALLRPEFATDPPARATEPLARNLLVTIGGTDPADISGIVLRALLTIGAPELMVRLVVGAGNARIDQLRRAIAAGSLNCELIIATTEMSRLMSWADLAISAAGTTTLELARMGVPMLLVIAAPNQAPIAEALAERGVAESLGPASMLTPEVITNATRQLAMNPARREAMSQAGRVLVDGLGARRVVEAIGQISA